MENNNNKYLQRVTIINVTVFEDENGNEKYQYGFMAKVWDKEERNYTLKGFLINSQNEYDLKEEIYVKSNKNNITGKIYFTEAQLNKINSNEDLPFQL